MNRKVSESDLHDRVSRLSRSVPGWPHAAWNLVLGGLLPFVGCCVVLFLGLTEPRDPPNIMVILADDLGFSDLGCYGGEIETPNLDGLARGGLRFTQFYNTARCWPTRASLLTGYYAQQVGRDELPGVPGGSKGKRPKWARLLPDTLRPLGYRSYHSGKWHIDGMPVAGGFHRSYYLRDQGRFFNPQVHWEDDRKLPPIEPGSGYYATTAIADHAIRILKRHAAEFGDRPFFHYLAFTAPHFPLHALPEDIFRFRDLYRRDWEQVRLDRWRRIREMGIVSGRLPEMEPGVGPIREFPGTLEALGPGEVNRPLPWSRLTARQREFQGAKMAIHAAMIHSMDREIGRVLDQLRRMDAFEDTLILFLSDNGASCELLVRSDGHDPEAEPGSAATFLCLGPGGSTVANTPFRRHKMWVHEGGIATPMIVHWPRGISSRNELRHNVGHVIDFVPTVLEMVGVSDWRDSTGESGAAPPLPGKSLLPVFAEDGTVAHDHLWWYHEKNRAVRSGRWKLVSEGPEGPWELYDLEADRTETTDLASRHPGKVRRLKELWAERMEEFRSLALENLADVRKTNEKREGETQGERRR